MNLARFLTPLRLGVACGGAATALLVTSIVAKPAPPAAALNGGATYAGEKDCLDCHAKVESQFSHTQHALAFRLKAKDDKAVVSCETCHGPGSKHNEDTKNRSLIVGFTREWGTPVAVQTQMCLQCHEGGQRMFWQGSLHATNDLSCSDCHNPMAKISGAGLLKKASINETCYTCHQQQRAEFAKRSHMPVSDGKMSCVDCHNPHGSTSRNLLKADTVNETCYNCHAEKRGPFLWEHAPVRDNCLSCHNAHGSNHDKLLTVARPFLCQQCHGNAGGHQGTLFNASGILGAGGNPNVRVMGHSCQNCHSQVHGTNHPGGARLMR